MWLVKIFFKKKKNLTAIEKAISASWEEKKATSKNKNIKQKKNYSTIFKKKGKKKIF